MTTPELIEAAAEQNEDAAGRLASVKEVIRGVLLAGLQAQQRDEPFSVEDAVAEAAPRAMAITLRPPAASAGASPPWHPPRYRLPDERVSTTGKLAIRGVAEAYRVTCGYYAHGELGEVFVRQEREGGPLGAMLDALATVLSIGVQYGIPWAVFEDKLKRWTFEPSGYTEIDNDDDLRSVSSMLDFMVRWVGKRTTAPKERLTEFAAEVTKPKHATEDTP
jgi:hypothetical protein